MTPRLMQLFDFTAEDLEYNRKGTLSPRQSARVTKKRRAQKLLLSILGLGLTCLLGGGLACGGLAFEGVLSLSTGSAAGVVIGVVMLVVGARCPLLSRTSACSFS
jgi:hypothetical protein